MNLATLILFALVAAALLPRRGGLATLPAAALRAVFDDFPSAFTPQLWANESIAILEENMVIGNLVHRDFENAIASYGDTVNTRKPGEFKAKRKSAADNVTIQANTAVNIPVVLNQHIHTSFIIKDADQSKAFQDLIVEYLHPAMLSIARTIDQIVGGQVYQFLPNSAGVLGGMNSTNSEDLLLDAREVLNINKAYEQGRNLIVTTKTETALLKNRDFTQAYAVGDQGDALRNASLGRKLGFDIFMAQNQPYVPGGAGNVLVTGAVNMASGAQQGATSVTVDGLSAAITAGTWVNIGGVPYRVTGTTGGATPTAIAIDRGLATFEADNTVVTLTTPGAINNTGGYPVGYDKEIAVDTFTNAPRVGQGVTFGTAAGSPIYCIIDVTGSTGITLDRGLEVAVADNDAANLAPAGSYNFAFHRNALALVNRPLALPIPGTGARAGVANWNGLSMRVVMTYDGNKQGHLVTVDTLMGVKVLDLALGSVLLG